MSSVKGSMLVAGEPAGGAMVVILQAWKRGLPRERSERPEEPLDRDACVRNRATAEQLDLRLPLRETRNRTT
jgi:hypothetical protein